MEALTLTFPAALIMGLAFGAGPCNIACLPYLGPVFLSTDGGIRSSWRTLVPFSLGRMTSYSVLGAMAGSAGQVATRWLEQGAAVLLGTATAAAGLFLLFRARRKGASCAQPGRRTEQTVTWHAPNRSPSGGGLALSLFGMGAAMGLNPCIPLGTVLLAAAVTGEFHSGLMLGFGFGVGAVLIPAMIFGTLVAHFGEQIRVHLAGWGRVVERAAAGGLVFLGGATAMGWGLL